MWPQRILERTFSLNRVEVERAHSWLVEHKEKCQRLRITVSFSTSSGIGMAVTIKCDCGEECNVTDYDSW